MAVYLALIVSVVVPLVLPGVPSAALSAALPHNTSGLVNPALLIAPMALLVLIGLRDKTIFLAARGEQYLPALFFFTVLPFVDMIIALKLLIVHGVDRRGRLEIRAPLHQRDTADGEQQPDRCPSSGSSGRTTATTPTTCARRTSPPSWPTARAPSSRSLRPLVLLFSPYPWLTVIAVAIMVAFHLFIISTFPLAVPLEWNVLFAYGAIFLFLGFPNWHGYAVADMSSPWLTVVIVAGLLFFPVLGNLRPDLVSFLPVDAAVRGQLGVGDVGVRARR